MPQLNAWQQICFASALVLASLVTTPFGVAYADNRSTTIAPLGEENPVFFW